jgi:hypothetical protein
LTFRKRRYLPAAVPKLNVVAVYKLLSTFLGCLVVLARWQINPALNSAVVAYDIGAVIRHMALPWKAGAALLSVTDRYRSRAVMNCFAHFCPGKSIVPQSKTGHCENQIRPPRVEPSQYPNVDAKGAQKLLKAIQANLALHSDDDEEAAK